MSEAKQQLYPGIRNPMADIIDKLHAVTDENNSLKDWQARAIPYVKEEYKQWKEEFDTANIKGMYTGDMNFKLAELRQLLIDAGVEVLFKYISRHHEMTEEKEKTMRAEARELLGIKDNNDKER